MLGFQMASPVTAQSSEIPYRVRLTDVSGHTWYADEPASKGGQDTAPTPTQLLLSALGACTAITLQMYANHKGIALTSILIDLRLNAEKESIDAANNLIERKIILTGEFDENQYKRLLKVAESCPIHKLLQSQISITTELEQI